jgi:hypothetical protein
MGHYLSEMEGESFITETEIDWSEAAVRAVINKIHKSSKIEGLKITKVVKEHITDDPKRTWVRISYKIKDSLYTCTTEFKNVT